MNIQCKCYNTSVIKQSLFVGKHPLYSENHVADGNTSTGDEPIDELVSRLKSMLHDVDLTNDITPDIASNIAISEMSGSKITNLNKRMLVLLDQNRITGNEYERVIFSRALI